MIGMPKEVSGTWLTGSDMVVDQNGEYSFNTKARLSGIGSIYPLAFRFDINDIFKEVKIEVKNLNTSAIELYNVYIVPDEDEFSLKPSSALYTATIDSKDQEAVLRIPELSDTTYDSYILVVEVRMLDNLSNAMNLVKVVFDGKSDGDVTDFTVTLASV